VQARHLRHTPVKPRTNHAALLLACAALAGSAAGCSEPLRIGDDVLWSADHETGDLSEWTSVGEGQTVFNPGDAKASTLDLTRESPDASVSVEVTREAAHSGTHALKLSNPGTSDKRETGMELLRVIGPADDVFYSAWFMLPKDVELSPSITIARLRSRNDAGEVLNGEELQLRSLPTGGYVLQVFNNSSAFLREPLPEQPPHLDAGRWSQLEARYESQVGGRLRVWLDGKLVYDLNGRPGAAGKDLVLSICNTGELFDPAPLDLFVDDVAVTLSRVGPNGTLRASE
jgi:hypothetical protein